jgi:hypothetical protein
MLTNRSTVARPTIAFPSRRRVWMAAKLFCPGCDRELRACEIGFDRGLARLLCSACHHDILTIERT